MGVLEGVGSVLVILFFVSCVKSVFDHIEGMRIQSSIVNYYKKKGE